MHSPETVAFEIYLGRKEKKNGDYRSPFITIWHNDPEKDGTDDSCGWFIRSRHIDPKLIAKVKKQFTYHFKDWFNIVGQPKFSTSGTAINMYSCAAWNVFMHLDGDRPTDRARAKYYAFMRKHVWDIMYFAENNTDSMFESIHSTFGVENEDYRIEHFTSIITADIMRKIQPWYKHPRWHVHHWNITFPIFRSIYRRYIERCDICRERFKKQAVYADWYGKKHWCEKCNRLTQKQPTQQT